MDTDTPIVSLYREASRNVGTFGRLVLPDGWECHSLELPWRDNSPRTSCIPPGDYRTRIVLSPRFGTAYGLADVPDRTDIMIHAGNLAGSAAAGLRSDVSGNILLGLERGILHGQVGVTDSKRAIAQFRDRMGDKPFILHIVAGPAPRAAAAPALAAAA